MQTLHILSSIDVDAGGPSRSVPLLCGALAKQGVGIELLTQPSANPVSITQTSLFKQANKTYFELQFTPLACDVVHLQHVWDPYMHIMARRARRAGIPYIITPRGMLEPWIMARHVRRKQLALWLYQRNDINRAACLHATCNAEMQQLRRLGFNNPIAVVPNGIDLSAIPYNPQAKNTRKVVFISRLHPKKGIELLLDAWKTMDTTGWSLEIAGEGSPNYVESLANKIKTEKINAQLVGAMYGTKKWDFLASAELMILPSYSENFGMVVAESLAMGVPVITTHDTPWQELETHQCGWWIALSVDNIRTALTQAFALTATERQLMGERGRELMLQNYQIDAVAQKMKKLYQWVLGNGDKPNFVYLTVNHTKPEKVIQFVSSIDKTSGGTTTFMELLAPPLSEHIALELVTGTTANPATIAGIKTHFVNLNPWRYFQIKATFKKLLRQSNPSLVHINGIWQPQSWWFQQAAQQLNIPVLLSPHGMLEPWILQRHPVRKQLALWFYQRKAIRRAQMLHATAQQELDQFRKLGFTNPAFIVPNGVDLSQIMQKTSWNKVTKILFLSRVHPKKGIDILIQAIAAINNPHLQITIAGEGEASYIAQLKQLASQLGVGAQFHFVGGVYGAAKWQLYTDADLYVLPTHSENFGIVIAEALYTGLPVITTTGAPWSELNSEKCGWWIELNIENLINALNEVLKLNNVQLAVMGKNGKKLVTNKYEIKAVALKMHNLYEDILNK